MHSARNAHADRKGMYPELEAERGETGEGKGKEKKGKGKKKGWFF